MESQKSLLEGKYGYFRMVLGMTRELVRQWPEGELDFRPVPEVRSARQIMAHMYSFLVEAAESVKRGRHETLVDPTLGSKAEILSYMDRQVERFYELWEGITDDELRGTVAAYGTTFPGAQFLEFAYDEHWHHRGQLTVYLRMCGVEPVMIYDYARL